MSNLEDPESVGYKVAAALSGTFLGIFLAYGIGIPLGRLVSNKLKKCYIIESLRGQSLVLLLDYP